MDATYSAGADAYREQIRSFLAEHLPAGWQGVEALPDDERNVWLEEWRQLLNEHRLLAPEWPAEYGGGGLSAIEQVVMMEEFTLAGAPNGIPTDTLGINMMGPTFLACGTEAQKRHYLPRILSGEDRWCQGYSEPDAGSDLAGLNTRAVRDGDEWVINGQKIWTSHGHLANWIFVLCRTDPDAPKHRGISFLLCELDQPGIEVRSILNAAGGRDFNEVFFTDARAPIDCIVGEPNEGWRVTNELLSFERGGDATTVPLVMQALLDKLIDNARTRGLTTNPIVRNQLAELQNRTSALRTSGLQTLTAVLTGSEANGASSISKVQWTELYQNITLAAMNILGEAAAAHEGIVTSVPLPPVATGGNDPATWLNHLLCARPASVYSGSNEIQRNIIGERVLGLPKEPRVGA
ncbi:MAG: alkylation response protein AidB-like acyl-CoA dehydrogenase [Acidimicrobiales bacterium]|jgi:alkylation response protein AidB-like acyl-CoA dehydrogenase